MEQISQNSKTKCFADISREDLTLEILAKTSCHQIPAGSLLARYPWKPLLLQCKLESSSSLSHTTHTMKSHIKYGVNMIKQNYNYIWLGIKVNTNSCKQQLTHYIIQTCVSSSCLALKFQQFLACPDQWSFTTPVFQHYALHTFIWFYPLP